MIKPENPLCFKKKIELINLMYDFSLPTHLFYVFDSLIAKEIFQKNKQCLQEQLEFQKSEHKCYDRCLTDIIYRKSTSQKIQRLPSNLFGLLNRELPGIFIDNCSKLLQKIPYELKLMEMIPCDTNTLNEKKKNSCISQATLYGASNGILHINRKEIETYMNFFNDTCRVINFTENFAIGPEKFKNDFEIQGIEYIIN